MPSMNIETLDFIEKFRNEDVKKIALQASRYKAVDVPYALTQISGYQALKNKVPSWASHLNLVYPRHLSLEQCSSEKTALYKASIVQRLVDSTFKMIDLTGGFGIDFAFSSRLFEQAVYVERQAELCDIARQNFSCLGFQNVEIEACDSRSYMEQTTPVDFVFLDPARRSIQGKKTVFIEDCEPNILAMLPLLLQKSKYLLIKLSPMLDLHHAMSALVQIQEVHIVATGNECKELLVFLSPGIHKEPSIICCNDEELFTFCRKEEETAQCRYTATVGHYLYEPNVALLKAGAFKLPATRFGLEKLHPNSHLYTSDTLLRNFPGRSFEVKGLSGFNKKELKTLLADTTKANLTIRNFPSTVVALRKRLKVQDGGNKYLFATTLNDNRHVLIYGIKA
ncbi:MAG: SAM-dependent methyltransferase [Bacteroidaceae bacterium]